MLHHGIDSQRARPETGLVAWRALRYPDPAQAAPAYKSQSALVKSMTNRQMDGVAALPRLG